MSVGGDESFVSGRQPEIKKHFSKSCFCSSDDLTLLFRIYFSFKKHEIIKQKEKTELVLND